MLTTMNQDRRNAVIVEPTDDGLFIAYFADRMTCYALGESENEATDNLLDRYDFNAESWADYDEYSYLAGAIM